MAMKPSGAKTMWQPTIPVDQSIYESSSTQKAPLGTRLEVGDRVFYYAQASAAENAGEIVCAPTIKASHGGAIVAASSAGKNTKVLTVTLGTSMAANEYAEGYVVVSTGGTSEGYAYRVKSHASYGAAATNCAVTLYDDLEDDVAAAAEVTFVPNAYKKVITGDNTVNLPVGVVPCDVTASHYFWLQTYGPAGVKQEGVVAAGAAVKLGTSGAALAFSLAGTTAGCVAATATIIGKNYGAASTDAEFNPIHISIRQ